MPPLQAPPASPQAVAQMGPPGGPGFGPGIQDAQGKMDKSPAELAVNTVEKILMGVNDDTFRSYVTRAMAILKVGVAMVNQQGPKSAMGGQPQPGAGGAPGSNMPVPPMPGQMPG